MDQGRPVLPAADVRNAEQVWAKDQEDGTWPLMVRAAKSFVRHYGDTLIDQPVLVVCGTGNNGGDGYYIAKLLKDFGASVRVWAPLGEPKPGIDAARAFQVYLAVKDAVVEKDVESFDGFIVDAFFGSGVSRPLEGKALETVQWMNNQSAKIYAVDVPSGLHADTGKPMPEAVTAVATHQFIALKPGTLTFEGPSHCGSLTFDSLNLAVDSNAFYRPQLMAIPERTGNTYKTSHGTVRVIGGRETMGGAAIMAGQSALRLGAGKVFVHCDPIFYSATLSRSPELMVGDEWRIVDHTEDVFIVGPGLGRSTEAEQLAETFIQHEKAQGVLDADALFWLAQKPVPVQRWVLTPHEGEAARLLGISSEAVREDRLHAAQKLADKYKTTVVLKGAGTIVVSEDKSVFCHAGDAAMATPGMGDVLAGMIGSLLGQGRSSMEAAVAAVNLHAQIGAHLAETRRVVLASDVIEQLSIRDFLRA